ncbi:unnamed protein product, partial [marine sediment metagenome]
MKDKKVQCFQCANCEKTAGVDNLKGLVVPVITAEAIGMRVQMKHRYLCGPCYDDFFYSLNEDWDAQKRGGEAAPPL